MSDNGTIVLDGLIISGGGSGGGTAATTSFEPTATITSDNVQDAIEEVDAKIENLPTGNVEILTKDEYDVITKNENVLYGVKKFSYSANFTTVGTPTIDENNVISGFSGSNYLHLIPSVLSLGVSTREIIFKLKIPSGTFSWEPFFSSEQQEAALSISRLIGGVPRVAFYNGTTAYTGVSSFVTNDIVWIKFNYNSTTGYTCHTLKDNGQLYNLTNLPSLSYWTEEFTTDYNVDILNRISAGQGNYIGRHSSQTIEYFSGSIYLDGTIIYENGSVKWQPYVEAFKGFVARVGAKPLFPELPFGEIYTADNTTAQTIPTGATYTKATAFNTAGEYRGITLDAANNKMTLTSAGYYKIGITASSKLGTAGVTLKTALFLDGVKVPNCQSIRKVNNANDESTVSFGGIVKVDTANSEIDVRVSQSSGGDVSLTTVFCSLNALYIGDLTL